MKKELIRLGNTNPALRPHIRRVLAAIAGRTASSATPSRAQGRGPARGRAVVGGLALDKEKLWKDLIHDSLNEVLEEIESDEEGWGVHIQTYRNDMTGTVSTNLGKMTSSGSFPNSVEEILRDAEEELYQDVVSNWVENNQDLMEEHGITREQVNYHDLHEMDLGSEAEDFSEIQMELENDEDLYVKVIVSIDMISNSYSDPRKPKMVKVSILAGWTSDGYYTRALQKTKWLYDKSFETPYDLTDRRIRAQVEKELDKHLKAARQAVA
jgi:hypothetical protein